MFKKVMILFIIFLTISFSVFSQENSELNPGRLSFGFNFDFGVKLDMTASIEFGFLLYRSDTIGVRDFISLNVYMLNDKNGLENNILSLSNKIIIDGGNKFSTLNPYTYIEGGIGFFGNDNKELWTTPLTYSVGLGIGLEIFAVKNWSLFFDTGLNWQFINNEKDLIQKFTFGTRFYF